MLATTAAEIRRAAADHKIAALMGVEGGHMIDDSLPRLREYAARGVRYLTLTHFKNNNWADSSTDKPAHNGLTPFGKVRLTSAIRAVYAGIFANLVFPLRPGEFLRVILRGATRPNAITVPQRAVLEGPQGKFVYVVDEKGTAQSRPLQLGEWAGTDWVVTGGLKPGDKVIVDGLMKLGPGAPVKIASAEQKPAAEQTPAAEQKPPAKK